MQKAVKRSSTHRAHSRPRAPWRAGWAIVLGVWSASFPAAGGDPRTSANAPAMAARVPAADEAAVLKLPHTEVENVRLVLLPANVQDRRGRIVRGLSRDDFRLYEDQIPQEIKYFTVEDREAIEVAFMLDVSGSMRHAGKLDEAKQAIEYFLSAFRPKDRFALICFADEQVSRVTEFTADRQRFLERLRVQEGYGQTALHDAVAAAPALVEETGTGKKAIILITDGVDNASRLGPDETVALARRASVPIYTIGFTYVPEGVLRRGETQTNLKVLERFAEETGGAMYPVRDPDDLKDAIARIVDELRYQYVIGYYPARDRWDGTYHRVRLEARHRGVEVRTRRGYFATP